MKRLHAVFIALTASTLASCSSTPQRETAVLPKPVQAAPVQVDPDQETAKASFETSPGTEEVTVTGVKPRQRLSLVDEDGKRLVVLKADKFGQAHFSYLPNELAEFQTGLKAKLPTNQGYVLPAGKGYTIRLEDTDPVQVTEPFEVLGYEDHPDPDWYDDQAALYHRTRQGERDRHLLDRTSDFHNHPDSL